MSEFCDESITVEANGAYAEDIADDTQRTDTQRTDTQLGVHIMNPTEHVNEYIVIPTGADVNDSEMRHYGITVKRAGPDAWVVNHGGPFYDQIAGQWGWLSDADTYEDMVAMYHYSLPDALRTAHSLADTLVINGRTYAQWAQYRDSQR